MEQLTGLISNIQHFSVDDGPGIRTTVFFKGCNLRCRWCHNPETYHMEPELELLQERCVSCGRCCAVCPAQAQSLSPRRVDRQRCRLCGTCVAACYQNALRLIGERLDVEQLLAEVCKDEPYYGNSGGGVTCSGGEPLLQANFLQLFLQQAKQRGLHTAVDTAGFVPFSAFEKVLADTDLFLFDLKAADSSLHRWATGVDNCLILDNLHRLSASSATIIIRTPLICGVNAKIEEIEAMAKILQPLNIQKVELLPYHSYGVSKYKSIGLSDTNQGLSTPNGEFLNQAVAVYQRYGLPVSCN